MKEKQQVSKIENGTVIDHIPPETTFKVLEILDLEDDAITVGNYLKSKKMGKKGLVKVSNKELSKHEINKIALIAPTASVCVIKNFKVSKKFKVEVPSEIDEIVKCFNPNCITRNQNVKTKFTLINKHPLQIKCNHCEKIMEKEEIAML